MFHSLNCVDVYFRQALGPHAGRSTISFLSTSGSVFDAKNYRGVHLISALSKIAEKVIGQPLLNYCIQERAFGINQWAYQKNRSSRDLLTFLSCTWVIAFCSSRCIAAFFSDIEGAFDRVCSDFLIFKLWALGVSNQFLMFLQSLLSPRHGFVCVQGAKSSGIPLENTVLQGTVLGSSLWNAFFLTSQQ